MNAHAVITDYLHERMQDEPIARRIQLTKALAEIAPTPNEREDLLNHVRQLEAVERSSRQLLLNLRARAA